MDLSLFDQPTRTKPILSTAYWRPIFDPYFDRPFIVMPLTGNLISVQGDLDQFTARRAARMAGLRAETLMPSAYFARQAILDTPIDEDAGTPAPAAVRIRTCVRWLLKMFPLAVAFCLLNLIFSSASNHDMAPKALCLKRLAASFGRRSQDDCLEMALCRYALMRLDGHRCVINIGLLAPSDEMHAWIEYRGHPILECEDVLVHYQACLQFLDKARP